MQREDQRIVVIRPHIGALMWVAVGCVVVCLALMLMIAASRGSRLVAIVSIVGALVAELALLASWRVSGVRLRDDHLRVALRQRVRASDIRSVEVVPGWRGGDLGLTTADGSVVLLGLTGLGDGLQPARDAIVDWCRTHGAVVDDARDDAGPFAPGTVLRRWSAGVGIPLALAAAVLAVVVRHLVGLVVPWWGWAAAAVAVVLAVVESRPVLGDSWVQVRDDDLLIGHRRHTTVVPASTITGLRLWSEGGSLQLRLGRRHAGSVLLPVPTSGRSASAIRGGLRSWILAHGGEVDGQVPMGRPRLVRLLPRILVVLTLYALMAAAGGPRVHAPAVASAIGVLLVVAWRLRHGVRDQDSRSASEGT